RACSLRFFLFLHNLYHCFLKTIPIYPQMRTHRRHRSLPLKYQFAFLTAPLLFPIGDDPFHPNRVSKCFCHFLLPQPPPKLLFHPLSTSLVVPPMPFQSRTTRSFHTSSTKVPLACTAFHHTLWCEEPSSSHIQLFHHASPAVHFLTSPTWFGS